MGATAGEHPRLSLIQVATSSSHDKGLHEPLSLQKDLLAWFDSKPERSVPWRRTGLSHQTRKHMNQEELFLYAYQV